MEIIRRLFTDELVQLINTSSYAIKNGLNTASNRMDEDYLRELCFKCREYACESIVDNLTGFEGMEPGNVYHLYCDRDHFYILARVRTNWEEPTFEETAERRAFLSFTVLTEKNLSHFPGRTLYGYYDGVTADMIGYICSHDANTYPYADTRLELSEDVEELLDIEDLCKQSWLQKTYCQVSVASKTKANPEQSMKSRVLLPGIVIAIDAPTERDYLAALERRLPILVLHRGADTIMRVYDTFPTLELSYPILN